MWKVNSQTNTVKIENPVIQIQGTLWDDGGMTCLQISYFDSNFFLLQVRILHFEVKVENVQLWIWATPNLIFNDFYLKSNDFYFYLI